MSVMADYIYQDSGELDRGHLNYIKLGTVPLQLGVDLGAVSEIIGLR